MRARAFPEAAPAYVEAVPENDIAARLLGIWHHPVEAGYARAGIMFVDRLDERDQVDPTINHRPLVIAAVDVDSGSFVGFALPIQLGEDHLRSWS
ncbi:hypothetical protein ABIB80_004965 [Bradyrhizobium sp. i1.15.2]|uniref:hypothetical protein n=1 Tax=Bradyrhizobium sp. i1.15.2 TaxID=3156362 RepID=UPI00339614CF